MLHAVLNDLGGYAGSLLKVSDKKFLLQGTFILRTVDLTINKKAIVHLHVLHLIKTPFSYMACVSFK